MLLSSTLADGALLAFVIVMWIFGRLWALAICPSILVTKVEIVTAVPDNDDDDDGDTVVVDVVEVKLA